MKGKVLLIFSIRNNQNFEVLGELGKRRSQEVDVRLEKHLGGGVKAVRKITPNDGIGESFLRKYMENKVKK